MSYEKEIKSMYRMMQIAREFVKNNNFKYFEGTMPGRDYKGQYEKTHEVLNDLLSNQDTLLRGYKIDPTTNKLVKDSAVELTEDEKAQIIKDWYGVKKNLYNGLRENKAYIRNLCSKSKSVNNTWTSHFRLFAAAETYLVDYEIDAAASRFNSVKEQVSFLAEKVKERNKEWENVEKTLEENNITLEQLFDIDNHYKKRSEEIDNSVAAIRKEQEGYQKEIRKISNETEPLWRVKNYYDKLTEESKKEDITTALNKLKQAEKKDPSEIKQQNDDIMFLAEYDSKSEDITNYSKKIQQGLEEIEKILKEPKEEKLNKIKESILLTELKGFLAGKLDIESEFSVEGFIDDGKLEDFFGQDRMPQLQQVLDLDMEGIAVLSQKELYNRIKAKADGIEKEITSDNSLGEKVIKKYETINNNAFFVGQAYRVLKNDNKYREIRDRSEEVYNTIKEADKLFGYTFKKDDSLSFRIKCVELALGNTEADINSKYESLSAQKKALGLKRDEYEKKITNLNKEKIKLENTKKSAPDLKKNFLRFLEGDMNFRKEVDTDRDLIKEDSFENDIPEQISSFAKQMLTSIDFNKGSHKDSKEFKAMNDALETISFWKQNNKESVAKNDNLKSFEEALTALGKAASDYIDAKNKQIRPLASSMRTTRLAFAEAIVSFAENSKDNCAKALSLEKKFNEIDISKTEYKEKYNHNQIERMKDPEGYAKAQKENEKINKLLNSEMNKEEVEDKGMEF